jgi:hypothetical protein
VRCSSEQAAMSDVIELTGPFRGPTPSEGHARPRQNARYSVLEGSHFLFLVARARTREVFIVAREFLHVDAG